MSPFYHWDDSGKFWSECSDAAGFHFNLQKYLQTKFDMITVDGRDQADDVKLLDKLLVELIRHVKQPNKIFNLNGKRHLLPVNNGKVVNLETGEIRDRTKEDFFTYYLKVNYDPEASSQVFDDYISDIMLNNPDLVTYLQTFTGYCFTGEINLEKLFFVHGPGGNGKSKFFGLLAEHFPEIVKLGSRSIVEKGKRSRGGASPDIYAIRHARLVYIEELPEGDNFDGESIKDLTGGNTNLQSRDVHKSGEISNNQLKLVGISNNYPILKFDPAIRRRASMIKFLSEYVDKPDPNKPEQKKAQNIRARLTPRDNPTQHREAIFNWIVKGAVRYYQNGDINPPQLVNDWVQEYQDFLEQIQLCDSLQQFLQAQTVQGGNDMTQILHFRTTYSKWCKSKDLRPLTDKNLTMAMAGKFKLSEDKTHYLGIRLKDLPPDLNILVGGMTL